MAPPRPSSSTRPETTSGVAFGTRSRSRSVSVSSNTDTVPSSSTRSTPQNVRSTQPIRSTQAAVNLLGPSKASKPNPRPVPVVVMERRTKAGHRQPAPVLAGSSRPRSLDAASTGPSDPVNADSGQIESAGSNLADSTVQFAGSNSANRDAPPRLQIADTGEDLHSVWGGHSMPAAPKEKGEPSSNRLGRHVSFQLDDEGSDPPNLDELDMQGGSGSDSSDDTVTGKGKAPLASRVASKRPAQDDEDEDVLRKVETELQEKLANSERKYERLKVKLDALLETTQTKEQSHQEELAQLKADVEAQLERARLEKENEIATAQQRTIRQLREPSRPVPHKRSRRTLTAYSLAVEEQNDEGRAARNERVSGSGPPSQRVEETAAIVEEVLRRMQGTSYVQQPRRGRRKKMRPVFHESRDERCSQKEAMRAVFKSVFNVNQDEDFMAHVSATVGEVVAYANYEGEGGPDPDDLQIDMVGEWGNAWNRRVVQILVEKFKEYRDNLASHWRVDERPDDYIEQMVLEKLQSCRRNWKAARPKRREGGILESSDEVSERVAKTRKETLYRQRHATRRVQKFLRRSAIVDHKAGSRDGTAPTWEWLRKVLQELSVDGMSSEESEVENDIDVVYRVKRLPWRRDMVKELHLIDSQRITATEVFGRKGGLPGRRIRENGEVSTRGAVEGLPTALYDSKWLKTCPREFAMRVSKKPFDWLDLGLNRDGDGMDDDEDMYTNDI